MADKSGIPAPFSDMNFRSENDLRAYISETHGLGAMTTGFISESKILSNLQNSLFTGKHHRDDDSDDEKHHSQCEDRTYEFTSYSDLRDFRVESCSENIRVENGLLSLRSTPQCTAATMSYRLLLDEGRVTMRARAAEMNGTVTCLVVMAPYTKDEMDLEITGADLSHAETMFWRNGERVVGHERSEDFKVPGGDASDDFIEYVLEYTKDYLVWIIDGEVVRVVRKDQVAKFPSSLSWIKIGVWDGSSFPFWAGTTDYQSKKDPTMYVDYLKIEPLNSCMVYTDAAYVAQAQNPVYVSTEILESMPDLPRRKSPFKSFASTIPRPTYTGMGVLTFTATLLIAWAR
ncbi:putative glycosidase CRH2 [Dispira simplex]|nr:putative glycosidase CRH2 [Dispira simplex]